MPEEAALAASVRELIELLPEHIRADDEVMHRRLDMCRQCDHLYGGMCVLCGCYVQLRAAKARMKCPDVPGRWSE